MPSTYTPIATSTAPGGTSVVTFSSIPSTYTDLILVCSVACGSFQTLYAQFNGNTTGNYGNTYVFGYGTTMGSGRQTNENKIMLGSVAVGMSNTYFSVVTSHIMNYSNTTTFKTVLSRQGLGVTENNIAVGTWRQTSAINSVAIIPSSSTFIAGSTFSLYGVKAA